MANEGEPEHKNINYLNDTNTEIYIDNKKTSFTKFIPSTLPAKDYEIRIVFKNEIFDCSYMFRGCTNIIKIDLSSFDTSNVDDMKHMFSICSLMKIINLSNLKTDKVTDMSYMFNKCLNLEKIEFPPSFITKNVKNMGFMFHMCPKLTKIDFPQSFITNNVTDMSAMFGKCYKIESLELYNFENENVKNMRFMFGHCHNLKKILIDSQKFKTEKVINMGNIFNDCEKLEFIDLSIFNTDNDKYSTNILKGASDQIKRLTWKQNFSKQKYQIIDIKMNTNNYKDYYDIIKEIGNNFILFSLSCKT